MMILLIAEAVIFPLGLLSLRWLDKHGVNAENKSRAFVVCYLSVIAATCSQLFPAMSVGRALTSFAAVACGVAGYCLARWAYSR